MEKIDLQPISSGGGQPTGLVSIIVPIYNVELYLRQCLDSILAQTYKNIEILLINDGSTDTSGVICQEYAEADSRIRYFEKENGGLSDARNVGIEKATGEYIIFVDSDDWIPENHVEFLYQKLQEQDADIAIGNLMGFRQEDYNFLIYFSEEDYFEKVYTREEIQEEFTIKYNMALCMTVSWGKIYKKSLFERVRFPVGKIHEDEYTTYRLYLVASKVVFVNKMLYIYRIRSKSITSEFTVKHFSDVITAYQERICLLSLKGMMTDIIRDYYSQVMWFYLNKAKEHGFEQTRTYKRLEETLYLLDQ